jgi:hypothetical protein
VAEIPNDNRMLNIMLMSILNGIFDVEKIQTPPIKEIAAKTQKMMKKI